MSESRNYAVSSGNGNDGVSHLYPDYIVRTSEPWLLALLAATSDFKPGKGRRWCRDNVQIEGEAEYTISACLYDPPGRDGAGWCDANGAWRIYEVYPAADAVSDRSECPRYGALEACFGSREVAIERRLDK